MNLTALDAAAKLIAHSWQHGFVIDSIPEDCAPLTATEGYAIQSALSQWCHDSVVGWKIAATALAGQKHIGVDGPIAGRLLASRVQRISADTVARVPIKGNRMLVAEAEFAFIMANDLPPRDHPYSQNEVMESVASLHPALEFPDSRLRDFDKAGEAGLAADNACAHEFVLGEAAQNPWRNVDLREHTTRLWRNGEVATTGAGQDVLGDPRIALTWLANNHERQGDSLKAGDIVTTGVTGMPTPIAIADEFTADLGLLGRVTATLC